MGTLVAVSYANIFMSVFKSDMLLKCQNKYKCKQASWSCFFDDFFFIWTGYEKSLKHYLNSCNNYSKSKGMHTQ